MTIQSIKDLPECVKNIVEIYYTVDSSAALAQARKSRLLHPEYALLIDITVELFQHTPESMYAFYHELIEQLASKPVKLISEKANFNAKDDVSETSRTPLFDDMFAEALNASFDEKPYLRPPAPAPQSESMIMANTLSVAARPHPNPHPEGMLLPDISSEETPMMTATPWHKTIDPFNLDFDKLFEEFDIDIDEDSSTPKTEDHAPNQDAKNLTKPTQAILPPSPFIRPPALKSENTTSPASPSSNRFTEAPNTVTTPKPTTIIRGSDILQLINSSHTASTKPTDTTHPQLVRPATATGIHNAPQDQFATPSAFVRSHSEHHDPPTQPHLSGNASLRNDILDSFSPKERENPAPNEVRRGIVKRSHSTDIPPLSYNTFQQHSMPFSGTPRNNAHTQHENKGQENASAKTPINLKPLSQSWKAATSDNMSDKNNRIQTLSSLTNNAAPSDALDALHPLSRIPVLCMSMGELSRRSDINANTGFILSLIDGLMSLADILSLSPRPQSETAEILCQLEKNQIIRFEMP